MEVGCQTVVCFFSNFFLAHPSLLLCRDNSETAPGPPGAAAAVGPPGAPGTKQHLNFGNFFETIPTLALSLIAGKRGEEGAQVSCFLSLFWAHCDPITGTSWPTRSLFISGREQAHFTSIPLSHPPPQLIGIGSRKLFEAGLCVCAGSDISAFTGTAGAPGRQGRIGACAIFPIVFSSHVAIHYKFAFELFVWHMGHCPRLKQTLSLISCPSPPCSWPPWRSRPRFFYCPHFISCRHSVLLRTFRQNPFSCL